jgi:hypothetical protein
MRRRNRVEWVSIKQDYDGVPMVIIKRESQMEFTDRPIPYYRPARASLDRALRLAEKLSGSHTVSLNFGAITNHSDMLIHMNLPRRS